MRAGKTNITELLGKIIPGSDCYLEGHSHTFASFKNLTHVIDRKRIILTEIVLHYVVMGDFLNWEGSYAVEKKFLPMPQCAALIELGAAVRGNFAEKKVKIDLAY